jgi:hypothetical protein
MRALSISDERATWLDPLHRERAALLCALLGLTEEELSQPVLTGERSVKDVLAHIAAWEGRVVDQLPLFVASDEPPFPPIDVDAFNARTVAERVDVPITEIVDEVMQARSQMVDGLMEASDEQLAKRRILPDGSQISVRRWSAECYTHHDRTHCLEIEEWRGRFELDAETVGEVTLAAAALEATLREFLAAARLAYQAVGKSLVTPEGWGLADFVGHVGDWDELTLEPLRQVAGGADAVVYSARPVDEHEDRVNDFLRKQRGPRTWDELVVRLEESRAEIVRLLRDLSDEAAARRILCPWPEEGSVYYMVTDLARHDREHSEHLRRVRAEAFNPGTDG